MNTKIAVVVVGAVGRDDYSSDEAELGNYFRSMNTFRQAFKELGVSAHFLEANLQ